MNNGDWITKKSELHKYAGDNDGSCVVSYVPYFDDGTMAACVFEDTDHLYAMYGTSNDWDYYFTDHSDSFPFSEYDIEENDNPHITTKE